MRKLIIEQAENGWILSWTEEWEEGVYKELKEVISAEETNEASQEPEQYAGMSTLLERVADFFGYQYNKFDKNNFNIKWDKKGHKLD